jgi:hypothetical protein
MKQLRQYIKQTINESMKLQGHDQALKLMIAMKDGFISGQTNKGFYNIPYSASHFPYKTPLLNIGCYIHSLMEVDDLNLNNAIFSLIVDLCQEDYNINVKNNKYKNLQTDKIKLSRNLISDNKTELTQFVSDYCQNNVKNFHLMINFYIKTKMPIPGASGAFLGNIVNNLPDHDPGPTILTTLSSMHSSRGNAVILHEFVHFLQFLGSYWLVIGRLVQNILNQIKNGNELSDDIAQALSADNKNVFYSKNLSAVSTAYKNIKGVKLKIERDDLLNKEDESYIFGGINLIKDISKDERKKLILKGNIDYYIISDEAQAHLYDIAAEHIERNYDTIKNRLKQQEIDIVALSIASDIAHMNISPKSAFSRFFDSMYDLMFTKRDYKLKAKHFDFIANQMPNPEKFKKQFIKQLSRTLKKEIKRQLKIK